MGDELKQLREKIRALDDELLLLVQKRMELARNIGAIKLAQGLAIKDYLVEKEVLARAKEKARQLGLYEELAVDFSKLLIRYAVLAQDEFKHQQTAHQLSAPSHIVIVGGLGRMGRWLADFFDSFGQKLTLYEPSLPAIEDPKIRYSVTTDFQTAIRQADVIILSTPISKTAELIEKMIVLQPSGLIFDICSLKSPLIEPIARARKAGLKIASVHPMFGPQVEVLADRKIVICDCGDSVSADKARSLFEHTSAQLVTIPLEAHDGLISYVLGLSHLSNLVFGKALVESGYSCSELSNVASTTFRSQLSVTYPLSHENSDLYFEIQAENNCTIQVIETMKKAISDYEKAIIEEDRAAFCEFMQKTRVYFESLETLESD